MNLRTVDLNLLVVLDEVLRENHVSRAATALSMSQPAVSSAINRLRRILGDPLLVRTGRTLRPTPFAEALKPRIRSILAEIEQTLTARPTFDPATDDRTFRLAATDYLAMVLLRRVVESLTNLAPRVRIVVSPVAQDYGSQLSEDKEDLLFLPAEIATELNSFPGMPLFLDRFVLAMWSGHPRRDDDPNRLVSEEPYLSWRAHGPSSPDRHLERLDVPVRTEMSTESLMTAPFLLRGTRLVTVIHERLAAAVADAADIVTRPLSLDIPPITQRMFWHSRRTEDRGHQWLRSTVLSAAEEVQIG